MKNGYKPRINAIVYGTCVPAGFDRQDYLDLALAALDQAGVSGLAQERILELAWDNLSVRLSREDAQWDEGKEA